MTLNDYHVFVNEMIVLRTMVDGLQKSLDNEKKNHNKIAASIKQIRASKEIERIAARDRIKLLEKELGRMKRSRYFPGIIGGARFDSDYNIEPTIGIGWKLSIF